MEEGEGLVAKDISQHKPDSRHTKKKRANSQGTNGETVRGAPHWRIKRAGTTKEKRRQMNGGKDTQQPDDGSSSEEEQGGTVDGSNSNLTLKEFVRSTVFKNIKFVVTDQEIEFGNHICEAVLLQLKIVEDRRRDWWSGHKKVVRKALADKRSTTNGMMKLEVVSEFGKLECSVNRSCFSNILSCRTAQSSL
jgi:hypothetical protein